MKEKLVVQLTTSRKGANVITTGTNSASTPPKWSFLMEKVWNAWQKCSLYDYRCTRIKKVSLPFNFRSIIQYICGSFLWTPLLSHFVADGSWEVPDNGWKFLKLWKISGVGYTTWQGQWTGVMTYVRCWDSLRWMLWDIISVGSTVCWKTYHFCCGQY